MKFNLITIRIGAAYDDVSINGHRFDRSGLDRKEKRAFRELVVETLFPAPRRPSTKRKAITR